MPWVIFVILLAAVVLIVTIRTRRFRPVESPGVGRYQESAEQAGPEKLAEAIRIPTISYMDEEKIDISSFLQFHALLEAQFPLFHRVCEKTVINNYSLLYRLKSPNPDPSRKPVLITAHMDVVPVEEGTESDWTEPPFSGKITDGMVWGRGTLDTKVHITAAMEALERLLGKGFSPSRDIWFAFGHDEELNGQNGALQMAGYLKSLGLEFDFVLDEGGCVATNVVAGLGKPIALVGIGEKGFANLRLIASQDGGHSSMPARHTSLGILAQAICRIEKHPMKLRLIGPTRSFLMGVGPYMKGLNKVILANLWLFKPLFLSVFSQTNSGSALLRTTAAVTMAQGSPAAGVIPQKSTAVVNCRILPGEDGQQLLEHFKKVLKGLSVTVEPLKLEDPSMQSPSDTPEFRYIESLIGEFCPDAIVAPYLTLAGTDARKYECVSKNIFRFTPYVIDNDDLDKLHGTNECISVANVNRCIDFFEALFERLS